MSTHLRVFAPRERSILARPGRAWYMPPFRTNSVGAALTMSEHSFGAWMTRHLFQALPGLAKIDGSFGANSQTTSGQTCYQR